MPSRELCRRVSPLVALSAILAVSASMVVVAVRNTARPGTGYVRFLVDLDRRADARAVEQRVEALGGRPVRLIEGPRLLAVRVPRNDASTLGRRLAQISGVHFVERNRDLMRTTALHTAEVVPTDPLWPKQWGPALIGAPAAWSVTMGSPRVVIAVLDTGVDSSQPDLRGALVPGYDFVDGGNDPTDDNGHGTRTAGIVAARADNGVGISGVCPRCSVMPVKVTGANGSASWLNVASGIAWATDHGASVISMSLGGGPSDAVAAAIRYAQSKGVLVVAAAGNNGSSQPFYPAADPGVLSVAGIAKTGGLYPWSDYGSWVDVAAPGCATTTFVGDGFGQFCGTSASAPVVAGLAGLARSYSPTSSAETIENAIVSSAHPVAGLADGRVDAVGTLMALGAKFSTKPATRSRSRDKRVSRVRTTASHVQTVPRARVSRGALRAYWHLRLVVVGGSVAATLHSPKARSCHLRLRSADGHRLSSKRGRAAGSLVASVAGGKYRLDVTCKTRSPRPALLTVHGARLRKQEGGPKRAEVGARRRGVPVPLAISFKPV